MLNAVARGVKLTIVTSPTQGVFEYAAVVHRNRLLATDVIADNKQALIAAPDLSACGYTDNELLAKHLQDFLEIMLKHYHTPHCPPQADEGIGNLLKYNY